MNSKVGLPEGSCRYDMKTPITSAKPIPMEQAEVREKLWTPDKEERGEQAGLWTPGQPRNE